MSSFIFNEKFAEEVEGDSVINIGVYVPLKDVVVNFGKWNVYIRSYDGLGRVLSVNDNYDALVSYSFGARFVSLYANREVVAFIKVAP